MRNDNENVKRCIAKRKDVLTEILGGKCCICGFNAFPSALEFHHVDPLTKEFALSSTGLMRVMECQLVELKKCILLCANCHRGVHNGYLTIPEEWQSYYNKEVAKQKLEEYHQGKIKQTHYCIDCGAQITRKALRCEACSRLAQRTCNRPSREELKTLIRTTPFTSIGTLYGVSDNAVRKWCKVEGLPCKKYDIQSLSDEEWKEI